MNYFLVPRLRHERFSSQPVPQMSCERAVTSSFGRTMGHFLAFYAAHSRRIGVSCDARTFQPSGVLIQKWV